VSGKKHPFYRNLTKNSIKGDPDTMYTSGKQYVRSIESMKKRKKVRISVAHGNTYRKEKEMQPDGSEKE